MPFNSEEIAITSEIMCLSSEEIRIIGEEMPQSSERITFIGEEMGIIGETIPGMNNAELRSPAWNLKVDDNRWRRLVVVVSGEVFKTLLYRGSDFTGQRHLRRHGLHLRRVVP